MLSEMNAMCVCVWACGYVRRKSSRHVRCAVVVPPQRLRSPVVQMAWARRESGGGGQVVSWLVGPTKVHLAAVHAVQLSPLKAGAESLRRVLMSGKKRSTIV